MSEIVEKVNEQNSAQNNEVAAPQAETVEDVTTNNIDAAVKAVPEADETVSSAIVEEADATGMKDGSEKSPTSPKLDKKKTPVKRTPSKRMSFIERAQKESEELVKNMGGSLEIEGGRKTRSSTRGTPTRSAVVSTPPPAKKSRSSPASGASTPTRPKARGRKIDVADDDIEEEESKPTPSKKKTTPAKGKKAAAKKDVEDEKEEEKPEEGKEADNKTVEDKEEKAETTETNLDADESKETPASSEQTNVDTLKEDETDAALQTVVEETQSQVTATDLQVTNEAENKSISADVVLEISESVKSTSPMDTDIEIIEEKSQDKEPMVQQTTEEPMEIDSSPSTGDDVIEISEEPEVISEPTKALESEQQPSTAPNNIEKLEENPLDKAVLTPAKEINSEESTAACNDLNKAENDLCEPKIATSPQISAPNDNSNATTPQTCN